MIIPPPTSSTIQGQETVVAGPRQQRGLPLNGGGHGGVGWGVAHPVNEYFWAGPSFSPAAANNNAHRVFALAGCLVLYTHRAGRFYYLRKKSRFQLPTWSNSPLPYIKAAFSVFYFQTQTLSTEKLS
jgi:hypothetical protein